MSEVRYCAHCDQEVEKIPDAKEWTVSSDQVQRSFRHVKTHRDGVSYCGRQFLAEHETYTEGESE